MEIVRQVDAGGAQVEQETESGLNVALLDARHVETGEPMAKQAGQKCGVKGLQFGSDTQVAVCGDRCVRFYPLAGEPVQAVLIPRGMGGEAKQGWGDVALQCLVQARKDVVAEAVAPMGERGVGGILAETEAVSGKVDVNVGASPSQEGSVKDEAVVEALHGFHARKASQTRATAGIGEYRFGLILRVVGEKNMRRVV